MRIQVSAINGYKYWFELYDHDHIVASCQVYPYWNLFSPLIQYYVITDIWVPHQYRGNQYAVALILNTMDRLSRLHAKDTCPPFRIVVSRTNRAAIHCCEKVFGQPYAVSSRRVRFSSRPPHRKWWSVCCLA